MHLKQGVLGYFTCIFQLLSAHWHAAGVGKDMHTQQHSICRRLNSSDVYKELLNPGGKEEFRAVVVEGVERSKLTNVRAVEWWEKGEQRKLLLLGHTETRVKMYQNMSSRIDWVPADDKRSRKWKCACGTRVKAVLSFWKMRKTDALKIVKKILSLISVHRFYMYEKTRIHLKKIIHIYLNAVAHKLKKTLPLALPTLFSPSLQLERLKFMHGRKSKLPKFFFVPFA